MSVPQTSVTLLKAIADDAASVRWAEFCAAYEPLMRDYLRARFPSLEADDVVQDTLVSLIRRLPGYRYTPDVRGHFRNYLLGIVRHKAVDALRRRARDAALRRGLRDELGDEPASAPPEPEDDAWKNAALETAVDQLMADTSVNPTAREVFRQVALRHVPPAQVAADFGISRGNVDVIKSRMIARLSALVAALTARD